jgi:hypothetical protein
MHQPVDPADSLREEIADLARLIDAAPQGWRGRGFFDAYDDRLVRLRAELATLTAGSRPEDSMTTKVTAVFKVTSKEPTGDGVVVRMMPPYCVDTMKGAPHDPAVASDARYQRVNEGWAQHTPSGSVEMYITNPGAAAALAEGEYYLLTFERYDPPALEPAGPAPSPR